MAITYTALQGDLLTDNPFANSNWNQVSTAVSDLNSTSSGLSANQMAGYQQYQSAMTEAGLSNLADTTPTVDVDTSSATQQTSLMQDFASGAQALSSLVSGYTGLEQLSLAEDTYDLEAESFAKNWAASVSSYNTALEDTINARAKATGMSDEDVADYISENSLTA